MPGENWTEHEFYMDWRAGERHPEARDIEEAPHPAVHLRTIMNLNSIGHFMRDSLMPLVNVALRFGLDPRDFLWVMCPAPDTGQWSTLQRDVPLVDHYESWIPTRKGRPNRTLWTDLMADFLGGEGVVLVRVAVVQCCRGCLIIARPPAQPGWRGEGCAVSAVHEVVEQSAVGRNMRHVRVQTPPGTGRGATSAFGRF